MPELPEVESLRRILARSAVGRTFTGARIGPKELRRRKTANFSAAIAGRRIESISRRAKYLIIQLDGPDALLIHLGMSGSLTHRRDGRVAGDLDPKHDHIAFALDDSTQLVFNDPRRFGLVRLVPYAKLNELPELKGLGPEPLGRDFNAEYLTDKARGRKVAIKNLLMDQRIVAGIGNIYASEVLFRAGVRPTRRAGKVRRDEIARIVEATPVILKAAISGRGTTFRSYLDSRGEPGRFASRLRVYGREDEPCYTCSTPITNVILGARASFYCPRCQR